MSKEKYQSHAKYNMTNKLEYGKVWGKNEKRKIS